MSTVTALKLCTEDHPKAFSFVSSTATVEAEEYVKQSDIIIQHGGRGLPETDDLELSRTTLTTGYGQSKWVAEKLIMEAGKRGLAGWTIRPSYVVGDSVSAGEWTCHNVFENPLLTVGHASDQHGRLYLATGQGLHSVGIISRYQ